MGRDDVARSQLGQATLRIRLAATALGATLLMLASPTDRPAAASVLLAYLGLSLALRAFGPRLTSATPGVLGGAIDILFAAALTYVLPQSPAWPLFAFAVGAAALRYGPLGVAATTAAVVVAYDIVLVARGGDAAAVDLWPVQVLLAFGLLAVELVWVTLRARRGLVETRAYSLAQRDCAAAAGEQELLDRIADHAVRSFGARWASVETERDGTRRTIVTRGAPTLEDPTPTVAEIPLGVDTFLRATFADDTTSGVVALRDLAADVSPLLARARESETQRREREVEQRVLTAIGRVEREATVAGVLAEVTLASGALVGASGVVRLADGELLAGDLAAEVAAGIGREVAPPRLVRGVRAISSGAAVETAAVVSVGRGVALVATGTQRDVTEHDVASLAVLGEVAGSVGGRIVQGDALAMTASRLRASNDELAGHLRDRDDAVASAVHELRNPLASVRAYGQLMARHLSAVQRQVVQLDALIEDLLHMPGGSPPRPLALETVDLAREAADAAARLRVSLPDTQVRVAAEPAVGPLTARVDPVRFAQVLDNVLGNAAKFSRAEEPIDVRIEHRAGDVVVIVTDRGDGIAAEDLDRIFERYTRAAGSQSVPGAGIGLAVSREIVTAHGGRIWAESAGSGRGSTFTIAMPATAAATDTSAPEGASAR